MRAHSTWRELSPGRTVTSQSASRGSSFLAPLKKPVSPEKTTAKRRQSGFSRMQAAMSAGATA